MPAPDANLYSVLRAGFPSESSAPAILVPGGRTWSYGDLERESAAMAAALAGLGVAAGDRVAVQVDKSPRALFLYLACVRAGFIYLPLNTAYQPDELAYFMSDAAPTAVVCRPESLDLFRRLCDEGTRLLTLDAQGGGSLAEAASAAGEDFDPVPVGVDDVASIIYTSGTTGRPKGAMLTHGNLASNARTLHRVWGFGPDDVLLHVLPIFHVHGLFVASNCALLNGTPMHFMPRFDARATMARLADATVLMGVPTVYTRLLAEPDFDARACAGMRLFISGSAPLLPQTFEAFRERTGHTILERYGMTETGMNTSNPLDGERKCGTVGLPLPGVEVRIVDENGRTCAAGEVGQIHLRGPNVFKGYWGMPERTAEEFDEEGCFRSGDLGTRDEDGYVSIVGRNKDLVITGGYNVYPKEVEQHIDRLPGVSESAVIGLPDADFGERVVAVVVAEAGSELSEAAIVARLRESLAAYKVPKQVFLVDSLPRNVMGKVQKNVLRERYEGQGGA